MAILSKSGIQDQAAWEKAGIRLPKLSYDEIRKNTMDTPKWVHIGPGNIFRAYIAALQQQLIEDGKSTVGITAVATFDDQIMDKIYDPYDDLILQVIMYANGDLQKAVVASVGESLKCVGKDWERLKEIYQNPGLQMTSFTITEKGYHIQNMKGEFYPDVLHDFSAGTDCPQNGMAIVASLLYTRYKAGQYPIAMVSMDNFSHNGDKLFDSVLTISKKWLENGFVEQGFIDYLSDKTKVSFPCSMIDKITPRPSEQVGDSLRAAGVEGMDIVVTDKNTYIAPYVNAESAQYLVVENVFPNGRPPLELAGVYFTDRQTVDMVERMKVCTCLNPLHTALAIFGCLLGYESIASEMKDPSLAALVHKISHLEGMPVVVDPKIIDPADFLKEVLEVRLPNPYVPDTPQRIATDTSQKLPIRFGETIKLYIQREDLDVKSLRYIPLTIAGWCRYLMGVDDLGRPMTLSPDPLLSQLEPYISKISFGDPQSVGDNLRPVLSNKLIFGLDLYEAGLGEKIEDDLKAMIAGPDAVKNLLAKEMA